jgi:hypothetical protein
MAADRTPGSASPLAMSEELGESVAIGAIREA